MRTYTVIRLLDLASATEKGAPVLPPEALLPQSCHEDGKSRSKLVTVGHFDAPESDEVE